MMRQCALVVTVPYSSTPVSNQLPRVQPVLSDEFENVIVLSDEFFQETNAHSIPTDLEAVRVLAPSPAVLDLFM